MFIRAVSLFFCLGLAFATDTASFPALTYSTYLRASFTPSAIATDSSGNIYLAGNAIVDPSISQATILVVKLNPQASQYLYVRYLGGSVYDTASALAVDSAGNAYIAGLTRSPDFPVTAGGNLGTEPVAGTERSFVAKLDPNGLLVFSDLLGGSTNSFPQAVAVNAAGQVLVSGTSVDRGFPTTQDAYSVPDTTSRPFLLELDPTGKKLIFSATGIGGNAITFDSSGNIYVAGSTSFLDYPTTAGTYQPTFPIFQTCLAPCHGSFQGSNQYVSKIDPTGSKLIFSTAVSGTGNTQNQGLAVDAAGSVYLTGLAGAGYPFTVTPPTAPLGPALSALATPALPFLSKLDPAGQKLLYSVPVGGVGVQVDSNGSVYVGGILGQNFNYLVAASLPALASLPVPCTLPDVTNRKSAYVSQVDSSGNILGSQFIGGSALSLSGVSLAGSTLWIAGATTLPDFPFSPNALTSIVGPAPQPGAYLGAVDFSMPQPPGGTPQIGCIVDAADLEPVGPLVPNQLLTIFGTGLGPATPVAASDYSSGRLGGVSVTFGSLSAPLLYVSPNQINVAVPLVPAGPAVTAKMQVTVNGVPSPTLQFPVAAANPTLFAVPGSYNSTYQNFFAVALNPDGSQNSSTNPAKLGALISVFVNGMSTDPIVPRQPPFLYAGGGWSVKGYSQVNPFVLQVNLQAPSTTANLGCQSNLCVGSFELVDLNAALAGSSSPAIGAVPFLGLVYLSQ